MSDKLFPSAKVEMPAHFEHLRGLLKYFLENHPDYDRNVFLMMRFRETETFLNIYEAIKNCLSENNLTCLRADKSDYSIQILDNICVHMLGCRNGIAVYEDIEEVEFSPNISLEVGFMLALGKRILILKDIKLKKMPADIAGLIYKTFDADNAAISIGLQIESWLITSNIMKRSVPETKLRFTGVSTLLGRAAKPPTVKETRGILKRLSSLYFRSSPPESEQQIIDGLKVLLSTVGFEFTQEPEEIHYEGRCCRPDLCSESSNICIKVKFCRSVDQIKTIIAEIIADTLPLRSVFKDVIFLVYDLGFISTNYLTTQIKVKEGVYINVVTQNG